MTPQLIERVKTNLKWLAEKMPEKFHFQEFQEFLYGIHEDDWCFEPKETEDSLIMYSGHNKLFPLYVCPDYQQEFSNSIPRIIKEAFGEMFFLGKYFLPATNTYSDKYHADIFKNNRMKTYVELESTTELSAQLEALCIRIERERTK